MKDKTLFKRYVSKMESIKHDRFKNINQDLLNGQNSYIRVRMKGSSSFNDEWIKKIEDCIYELGQIVNNPLEVTTTEGSVTPVELAKKINYESIQHLASHTQYIKEIDEEGNVIPSKILSQFHTEQLHTYENKFIATFIRRLVLFVEKRYDFIRSTVNFDTKEILFIKNKSKVDGQDVEIETKVTLKRANDDAESNAGREFVKRIEAMRRYVNYFYTSPFMKELKTEKDVRKPILQTNIIRKNPLYHKCYETFLFIEKFQSLGVEYAVDENYQEFSEKERKNLNYILSSNVLSLESTEESKVYKSAKKVYKPKLLPSCDDEMFIYGDLVKGPIEFVRADEKYIEYLNKKIKKDIPLHPNKAEKEYYKDEIEERRDIKTEIKEIEALLARVRRQIAQWEKKVEKLIAQRNLEEAREAQRQLDLLRKEEARLLDEKRRQIIAAAQGDKSGIKAEEAARKALEEEEMRRKAQEAAQRALEEVRRQEEEARKAEEARLAEEKAAREAEEARIALEEAARKAEEERIAKEEAARKAEEERLAAEAEAARKAEEERLAALAAEQHIEEPQQVEETPVEVVSEPVSKEQPEEVQEAEEEHHAVFNPFANYAHGKRGKTKDRPKRGSVQVMEEETPVEEANEPQPEIEPVVEPEIVSEFETEVEPEITEESQEFEEERPSVYNPFANYAHGKRHKTKDRPKRTSLIQQEENIATTDEVELDSQSEAEVMVEPEIVSEPEFEEEQSSVFNPFANYTHGTRRKEKSRPKRTSLIQQEEQAVPVEEAVEPQPEIEAVVEPEIESEPEPIVEDEPEIIEESPEFEEEQSSVFNPFANYARGKRNKTKDRPKRTALMKQEQFL